MKLSDNEKQLLVQEFRASGLAQREFCALKGIAPRTFRHWLHWLNPSPRSLSNLHHRLDRLQEELHAIVALLNAARDDQAPPAALDGPAGAEPGGKTQRQIAAFAPREAQQARPRATPSPAPAVAPGASEAFAAPPPPPVPPLPMEPPTLPVPPAPGPVTTAKLPQASPEAKKRSFWDLDFDTVT